MYSLLYKEPGNLGFEPQVLSDRKSDKNKGRKLCLVSDTRAQLAPTAYQMAEWFVADGWEVTLLDLSEHTKPVSKSNVYTHEYLKNSFQEKNWYSPMQSLCAYHWLKDKKFDTIIFQHGFAAGFFSCVARKLRLAFETTPIIIMPDDPYAFWLETSERIVTNVRTEAELDFLERATVDRADGVFFTNRNALEWMINARWDLGKNPERIAVLGTHNDKINWGNWFADKMQHSEVKPKIKAEEIFISVCISSYNRPHHLRETIKDLLNQSYKNFEVILVNTTDPGVEDPSEEFKALFEEKKWTWLKQPKLGMASACNYAASKAKGTHILFKDDDNISLPDELEIFARSAQSGADVYMSICGQHYLSDNVPDSLAKFPARSTSGLAEQHIFWIHFGPVLANGMNYNVFGDTNSLIRRDVFEKLKLFDIGKPDCPDWSGYGRAALAGYRFESIPESLFLYRYHSEGWCRKDKFKKAMTALRLVYADHLPSYIYPVLLSYLSDVDPQSRVNNGRYPDPLHHPDITARIGTHNTFSKKGETTTIPEIITAVTSTSLRSACVMIVSLLVSTKSAVKINVISSMRAEENAYLVTATQSYGPINIIPSKATDDDRLPPSRNLSGNPTSLFWHLLIPEYLPQAKRVIALDCNVLVRKDIIALWNFDLAGKPLAAAVDLHVARAQKFKNKYHGNYFHPGVMLIDLETWKKQDVTDQSIANLKDFEDRKDVEQVWGQTSLNHAVKGNWMPLSPTWNWMDTKHIPGYEDLQLMKLNFIEYEKIMCNPSICRNDYPPQTWQNPDHTIGYYGNEINLYRKLIDASIPADVANCVAA